MDLCMTDKQVGEFENAYGIAVQQAAPGMTILNGVPCRPFNKERTNLLLLAQSLASRAFVDADLIYEGGDPLVANAFSGKCQNNWRLLAASLSSDPEEALLTVLTTYLQSPAAVVLGPERRHTKASGGTRLEEAFGPLLKVAAQTVCPAAGDDALKRLYSHSAEKAARVVSAQAPHLCAALWGAPPRELRCVMLEAAKVAGASRAVVSVCCPALFAGVSGGAA